MTQPLGEEFIQIRPSFAGFNAELRAGVAAALQGVAPQIAATQAGLTRTSGAAAAQTRLGGTARTASKEVANLQKNVQTAETAAGRYTRGMFAATAASTGFFRAVSFASGAFLVGALAGGAIASAVQEFRDATIIGAQTAAVLRATGEAANVTAAQVDKLATSQLKLTGIDDELVKSAANVLLTFRSIRNEVGRGNQIFTRAVQDVQDISSVFGTALTGSAVQLGKALQDPIRGVTALRRSGITLSQSQRDLIKRLVETGRILTAQKIILGEVEHQVGGTARAIGRTLPGQLNILKESAKNALGDYVKRVQASQQATELAAQASQTLSQTFGTLRAIVRTLGPPLLVVAQALGRATQAIGGAGAVLGAVAAYKALTISLGLATAAQAFYLRATTASTVATEANATATSAAAVVSTRAAASVAATNALAARAAALSAASAIALGTGATFTAARLAAMSGATRALAVGLSAVGGPLGVAALGVGALTLALIHLKRASDNMPGSLNALRSALQPLQQSVGNVQKLREAVAAASEDVSLARFNRQAAGRDVNVARGRVATSTAAPGSLEQRFLADQITQALQKQRSAEDDLTTALDKQARLQRQLTAAQLAQPFVIGNTTRSLKEQIETIKGLRQNLITGPLGEGITLAEPPPSTRKVIAETIKQLTVLQRSGNETARAITSPLLSIIGVLRRLPTQKEIRLVFKLVGLGRSQQQILSQLGIGSDLGGRGQIGTNEPRLQIAGQRAADSAALREQRQGALALLNSEKARLRVLRETAAKRNEELQTQQQSLRAAKDAVANAREGLAAAVEGLAAARQALADTIRSSREAVNQAVQDAKSNLDTLGQAVADTLQKFRDEGSKVLGGGKLGANFQALKQQILAGGGGPETQRAAQQLSNRLQARPAAPDASKLAQGFADLTDKLNRGRLSLPQFNKQLAGLLKGFDFKAFRQQFGSAAANLLRDQIAALRKQARLVTEGPQRRGGGAQQTIVNPLRAVAQGARDIAAAQHDVVKARAAVVRADHDLTEAINDLRRAEVRERRANTAATKANSRVIQQLVDVMKAEQSLRGGGKKKPKGDAGKTATDQTSAGATAP